MQRTRITVTYQRTHNLGNYSNVRPSITIEAIPDEGEDVEAIKAALMAEARAFIHDVIDEALEGEGQPAKFSDEPRYRLSYTTTELHVGDWGSRTKLTAPERLLVLTPAAINPHKDGREAGRTWWSEPWGVPNKARLAAARQAAAEWLEEHEGYHLIDCSDGDLSRIPAWVMEEPKAPAPPAQPETVTARAHDDYTPIGRDEDEESYAAERARADGAE
jgi:hypothetical protein